MPLISNNSKGGGCGAGIPPKITPRISAGDPCTGYIIFFKILKNTSYSASSLIPLLYQYVNRLRSLIDSVALGLSASVALGLSAVALGLGRAVGA